MTKCFVHDGEIIYFSFHYTVNLLQPAVKWTLILNILGLCYKQGVN